ncbi:hypothetical protein BC827DRAFT_1156360 [Russula dissimulans]|nr:hypothetical protein BC827DRAFT_1156360 [Russula dissimulans]
MVCHRGREASHAGRHAGVWAAAAVAVAIATTAVVVTIVLWTTSIYKICQLQPALGLPLEDPTMMKKTPTLKRRQGGPVDHEEVGLKVLTMSPWDSGRRRPPPAIPRPRQVKTRGDPSVDSSGPQGGTT